MTAAWAVESGDIATTCFIATLCVVSVLTEHECGYTVFVAQIGMTQPGVKPGATVVCDPTRVAGELPYRLRV